MSKSGGIYVCLPFSLPLSLPPYFSPPSYLEEVVGGDHFLVESHVDRGVTLLVRHHALQLVYHMLGRLLLLLEEGMEAGREGRKWDELLARASADLKRKEVTKRNTDSYPILVFSCPCKALSLHLLSSPFSSSAYLEAVEVELEGGGGRTVLEVHVVGLAVLGMGHGHGRLLRVHQHGRVAAQRAVPGRQVQLEGRREGGKI